MESTGKTRAEPTIVSAILERVAGVAMLLGLLAFVCGFDWLRFGMALSAAMLLALGRLIYVAVRRQRGRHLSTHGSKETLSHSRLLR